MSEQDAAQPKLNAAAKSFVPKTRLSDPSAPGAMELNADAKEFERRPMPMPAPFMCIVPAPFYHFMGKQEDNDEEEEEEFEGENEEEEETEEGKSAEEAKAKKEAKPALTTPEKYPKEDFIPKPPEKIYERTCLLTYKEKCQRRPKDMRPIEIPLKSKTNIQFGPYEQTQRTEAAETVRNLRILLNKLARENFARVSDTILNNFAYTPEILQEFAKILFNKCIKEPKYIHLYIELVDQLFHKFKTVTKERPDTGKETIIELNFRRMFLNSCQEAFENQGDEEFLKELPNDLSEEERAVKKKQRVFGNIKLIGELFAHGAINDLIVVQCMARMRLQTAENSVENLCHLLLTIGKKLYEYFAFEARLTTLTKRPKLRIKTLSKEMLDDHIDYLTAIKQTDKVNSRVKFLVQDVIDARNNDWSNAFNRFPVTKPLGGREEIVAYRKKTKSIETPVASPTRSEESKGEKAGKEVPDSKVETREQNKRDANERNVFGRNIEKYQKTKIEERLRLKLQNMVEEYLLARKLEEFKENLNEVVDQEKVMRQLCIGHFLLYSFTKGGSDFRTIYQLVLNLAKSDAILVSEVEEGIVITLANFYDTLIDSPNAPELLKEMLKSFETGRCIGKDFVDKCVQHLETLKRQLEGEYGG